MDILIGIFIGAFGMLWSVLLLWIYLDNWMYKRELMKMLDVELDKFIERLKLRIEDEFKKVKNNIEEVEKVVDNAN